MDPTRLLTPSPMLLGFSEASVSGWGSARFPSSMALSKFE
jgi:hypothetical protein